ncbi:transposase zinc-binding domain-containing protein [Thermoanaerobacterium sp. RBIITD]|uniref:transposase zinc-binding domain-containing protein n=1 Tax=Thermoanaerobacterium sp. RBIITD TaxID=1550240 RepID=UPI000BB7D41E
MLNAFSRAEVYTPRSPRKNQYYRCVEAHFEELEGTWEDRYQKEYGYWRPYLLDVIYKYLDCGDLHLSFARVKCDDCNHEYLLPFSCKRRHFCPSCHQKRVVEFGEFLYGEVLKRVPHRQWVFSIPKRLRLYFMYDRRLLAKLSQCA